MLSRKMHVNNRWRQTDSEEDEDDEEDTEEEDEEDEEGEEDEQEDDEEDEEEDDEEETDEDDEEDEEEDEEDEEEEDEQEDDEEDEEGDDEEDTEGDEEYVEEEEHVEDEDDDEEEGEEDEAVEEDEEDELNQGYLEPIQPVLRSDKTVSVLQKPPNWSSMEDTEIKTDMLHPSDKIYSEVENMFKKSVARNKIISIERIQNWTLYKQYDALKQNLESRKPGKMNERKLWHGTSVEAIESINLHGFNRSYCGKNATMHGEGVYFAVNAKYSSQEKYSPSDGAGLKRMYLANVLTGQYTKGSPSYKVPPPIDRTFPHVLYDSVTDNTDNPNTFVIFKDAQAYPTYLVTFST